MKKTTRAAQLLGEVAGQGSFNLGTGRRNSKIDHAAEMEKALEQAADAIQQGDKKLALKLQDRAKRHLRALTGKA